MSNELDHDLFQYRNLKRFHAALPLGTLLVALPRAARLPRQPVTYRDVKISAKTDGPAVVGSAL